MQLNVSAGVTVLACILTFAACFCVCMAIVLLSQAGNKEKRHKHGFSKDMPHEGIGEAPPMEYVRDYDNPLV